MSADCWPAPSGGAGVLFSVSASSRAVTVRSRRPQASAARAASRGLMGRRALIAAASSVPPATQAPAIHHRFASGTKDVTASRIRAARAPPAKPQAAPETKRCRRRRRLTGPRAFKSSFIFQFPSLGSRFAPSRGTSYAAVACLGLQHKNDHMRYFGSTIP